MLEDKTTVATDTTVTAMVRSFARLLCQLYLRRHQTGGAKLSGTEWKGKVQDVPGRY